MCGMLKSTLNAVELMMTTLQLPTNSIILKNQKPSSTLMSWKLNSALVTAATLKKDFTKDMSVGVPDIMKLRLAPKKTLTALLDLFTDAKWAKMVLPWLP